MKHVIEYTIIMQTRDQKAPMFFYTIFKNAHSWELLNASYAKKSGLNELDVELPFQFHVQTKRIFFKTEMEP